jgi:VanZ family protein
MLHFIEYSILGAGLRYWSGGARPLFLIGGAGFAALDEFHQRYVPGREASLWDWTADLAGLAVGFLLYIRFAGRLENG